MKARKSRLAYILVAFLTLVGMSPSQAADKVVFLFPSLASLPAFAPYMLAKYKGYYKAENLDVEFQTGKGGTDVAAQLGAGNADLGGGVGDTTVIVRPNENPGKVGRGSWWPVAALHRRACRQQDQ